MLVVPIAPYTVTAFPATPRRSASGAQGDCSSHSPNTMPASLPGVPKTDCDVTPAVWPARFRMTRRMVRPIAGAPPPAPPRQLTS
jgi:hypothetical protein